MGTQLRLAGAGMTIGGLLFFGRMAPIFSVLPEDMDFPPTATEDLVRLAELAGSGWQLSHGMGLIAVMLFAVGYWAHAHALTAAGHTLIGKVAAATASLAFGLFAVALVTDGFVLFDAANEFIAGGPDAPMLETVAAMHERALLFFTPAIFLMFIAMGILSSRMIHGFIHSRWLGFFGMALAITGPTAYLFGITGPNWDNLQIGGSLMMLGFIWHLIVGLAALFGRGAKLS